MYCIEIHAAKDSIMNYVYTHGVARFRSNSAKWQHNNDSSAITEGNQNEFKSENIKVGRAFRVKTGV